jgi:hypothetical protein
LDVTGLKLRLVQKQEVADWSEYARRAASALAGRSGGARLAELPGSDLPSIRADKAVTPGDNAIS